MPRMIDLAEGKTDVFLIDPRKIELDPGYNVPGRELDLVNNPEDRVLKESIRSHGGVKEPLRVRLVGGSRILLVAGHKRREAVLQLVAEGMEIKAVPCMNEPRGTQPEDRDMDLLSSNSGQPLTALQKGHVMKRRIAAGWTEEQVAEKAGMKLAEVQGILDLMGADDSITEMVRAGKVAPRVAIRTMKKSGERAPAVLKAAEAAAKASGLKRVSAKTIEASKADLPAEMQLNARGKRQIPKKALVKALREILEHDEVPVMHHIAREVLGIRKTHLEAAENAEILREFKVTGAKGSGSGTGSGTGAKSQAASLDAALSGPTEW